MFGIFANLQSCKAEDIQAQATREQAACWKVHLQKTVKKMGLTISQYKGHFPMSVFPAQCLSAKHR